jgi:hypothetical protein
MEHVFRLHGQPQSIVSDRDPRFTSRFWMEVMKLLGTRVKLSSAFHPQTDGQTERVNRTLEQMLRMFVGPRQDNWDELLPVLEFACNNAVHDSTGYTPFVLNSGRHPATPLERGTARVQVPAVKDFTAAQRAALVDAKAHLLAAQQRQKSYADTARRELTLAVGAEVLLSTKHLRLKVPTARKLLPRFIGPFRVSRRVGEVAYKLDLPSHMRIHDVFHVSLLRPYEADKPLKPPAPIVLSDGSVEYRVDHVLLHRIKRSGRTPRKEYLIKWEGYGPEHNSWEPERNLPDSLIRQYWDELGQRAAQRAALGVQGQR